MNARQASRPVDTLLSIVAAMIVLAVLVGTVAVWLTAPDGAAAFELDVAVVDDRLEVAVSNIGGEVATEVVVRAIYVDTEAEQTLAWLSPGETNHVVFVLEPSADPSEVDVRVVSYVSDD
jgi:uncharacterized protein (TIGR02588 family)